MFQAVTSFWIDGSLVSKGAIVAADDPMVVRCAAYFMPVTPTVSTVEQATAAPGEKRSVGRPRKSAR